MSLMPYASANNLFTDDIHKMFVENSLLCQMKSIAEDESPPASRSRSHEEVKFGLTVRLRKISFFRDEIPTSDLRPIRVMVSDEACG